MIVKLSDNFYVVRSKVADVGVQFGTPTDLGYAGTKGKKTKVKHVPLGMKDQVLQEFHNLASESPNKWPLMKTRRDFLLGKGIDVRTRIIEDGEKKFILDEEPETVAIEDFLEEIGYQRNLRAKAMDFCFCGRYYVLMKLALNGTVESFERVDVFHCRPGYPEERQSKVTKYLLNPNFGTKLFKDDESVEVPAFDRKNPTAYPVCVIDVFDSLPGQTFHPFSEWWGTKEWTEVTNKIPKFHSSGLDNGYNIKYHISVPDDYFKKDEYVEGMDEDKLKTQTLDNIGDSMAGVENADKVLFTFHKVFSEGRYAESGIKITPLPNPMSDDAYTKLFTTANEVQASGHRVSPVLAGVNTGGKLGGSGKELESSANYQQGFLTHVDRELLLEDFYILKKIMGWSRNKVAMFEDIKLYTYDVTPTGAEQNPNSDANQE